MKIKVIATGVFFAISGVIACSARQPIGGYSPIAVTNKEVMDAAASAVKAQQKVMQSMQSPKTEPTVKLELVTIIVAEQQVVAGMNYRLKLKVKVDGREKLAETVVWWQAWRKPVCYQLISWSWE